MKEAFGQKITVLKFASSLSCFVEELKESYEKEGVAVKRELGCTNLVLN